MAETVGQHSVAAFTSPVNGTSPIDANTVKGNDNTIRSAYVDHDADPGIHVQSSTLASRPTANSAGRKWMTADSGVIRLFYDDGTNWYEADYLRTTGGTISGNLAVTGTLGVTGVTTLTAQPILSSLTASQAVFTDASKGLVSNAITGTGNVVMSASPTLTGTIQAAAANLSGALGVSGLLTFASLKGTGATTVTNILDEDNMASDSATALATQQSIKAYVDAQVGASDALSEVLAIGNTTGANDIIVSTGQKIRTPAVAAGDGSAAITIANTTGALTFATALADSNLATISTAGKVANSATTATDANTASAIVARDASGNFSAGTITAALTGNASTATALQTARTINGTSFDGTANITVTAAAGTLTGTTLASNVVSSSLTSVGTLANLTVTNPISGSVTGSSGSTTGNAATATALQTARNINGVSFNGTADITVTAAAGTLTGTTLASGVTASSLTSVGTLTSLTVSGNLTVDTNTLFVDAANNRVGIGLTNPGTALDITGASGTTAATVRLINSGTAAGDYAIYQLKQGTGSTWQMFTGANSDTLTFGRSGVADYLYLTNSGNLGLGVTPSAWGTTNSIRALQLNSGALWNFSTGGLNLIQNGYYDGSNYKYVATAAASQYSQSSGAHSWSIAASGTAGNNISFTQAMTLGADTYLTLNGAATDGRIQLTNTARSTSDGFWVGIDGTQSYLLSRGSYPLIFYTNAAERARITSGGSFLMAANSVIGLNTSDGSDNGYLALVGAGADGENRGGGIYLHGNERSSEAGAVVLQAGNVATTGIVSFRTGAGTERARITSGGYFKASNTGTYHNATGTYHELYSTSDNNGVIVVKHAGASGAQYGISILTVNDQNDATRYFWACDGGGTERATLRSNGGLANYSANNVNLASDFRLKKDIAPLTSTWDKLKAIEVVNFRYKDCNEGDPALYGVIAQQVQPIVPELVVVTREAVEAKDAELDEDGNEVKPAVEAAPEYYGIREQPMYWLAIKTLQEAQARIEALEARLEALEA